jgi:calcineurin-like phosphoesterase family protein
MDVATTEGKTMSEVWYTSDLHIGHKLVATHRGFWYENPTEGLVVDVAAHDLRLAQNWDAIVAPDDVVFVLGDISINGKQHALDWIAERPGTKHLITGNHDPVWTQNRKALGLQRHWLSYFETINEFVRRKLEGETILLSHFPYESWGDGPDRPGSRWNQYRLPELGDRLLHGHTHGNEREHGTMFHVGVDAWDLRPVPQSAVQDWILRTRP